jgi:transcriptional regulator GlxA family with amidase domain
MPEDTHMSRNADRRRVVGALLFPEFELLDVFGPLEMLGVLETHFEVVTLAETDGLVASAQGPRSAVDRTFAEPGHIDVLLLPGGWGTRQQAANPVLLRFLRELYPRLEILASICTGSGVLAASGLLNGRRATSNKLNFAWAQSQGPDVVWVPEARWVEDGNIFTASGVTAGMDMALALIARLVDQATAEAVARGTEYEWHQDAAWDPFAKLSGLV